MNNLITDILAIPGLSAVGDIVQVGIKLANGRIFWALCDRPDTPDLSGIRAALVGQSVQHFRLLAEQIAALTEMVTITQPIPEAPTPKLSRRALFTGLLATEQLSPKTEQIVEKRPFPAPLQYALTAALLMAVADQHNQPIAAVIAQEYETPASQTAVSLCYALSSPDAATIPPAYRQHITAVSYTVTGNDMETELGKNGELLQRQVRQLAGQLGDGMQIYLTMRGGFGRLYGNNVGKLLGALYGLERAAKPCQIAVIDAVTDDLPLLRQLKEYVKLRKMSVQLGVEPNSNTLQPALEADTAHFLSLHPAHLGNLHHTIQAILGCQQKGGFVLLHGTHSEVIHLAMGTQTAVINGKNISQAFNEREKLLKIRE